MILRSLKNDSAMVAEVKLKNATDESIPFITSLLRSSGLPFEDIQSRISCLFIGYAGSEVIGIGGVEMYGRSGMLRSLVIQESLRVGVTE
jgi:amino-acid N-acetyltransferase